MFDRTDVLQQENLDMDISEMKVDFIVIILNKNNNYQDVFVDYSIKLV